MGGNGERERGKMYVMDGSTYFIKASRGRKEGWRVKRCGFDCMIPRIGATFYIQHEGKAAVLCIDHKYPTRICMERKG